MSFRSDSLHDRLTEAQRHELMICIRSADTDRFAAGLDLCASWKISTSRTAVHDFYKRYFFGWRVELGAWVSQHMENMPGFQEELKKITQQKLFAEIADADCPPKMLILARALQIEEEKIQQRERLATNRGKLETEKLKLADRRVKVLESKIVRASEQLKKLRDPKKADDAKTREAILNRVDELMGIKSKK